jgi:hypothetical protein
MKTDKERLLADVRGEMFWGEVELYNGKKTWSSINDSILSDLPP